MAKYAAAIDQGTTSSRCMVFDHGGQVVSVAQKEHEQIYPKPGWVEHDADEIWARTQEVVDEAVASAGAGEGDIAAVGITNQRETTLVWDRNSGEPVHNALVWQDTRTDKLVDEFSRDGGQARFQERVGLPLATYFSGPKVRWILDNVDGARDRAEAGDLLFGNMDTWLIWNLTGGTDGGLHVTDVSNASRTMLMDLASLSWDEEIAGIMGIPTSMLPEIKASSEVYGDVSSGGALQGVPIAGDLGDQQAATFGQTCFSPGEAKNTYGTGNFLLLNTGTEPVQSKSGLLTTAGYKIGDQDCVYCLEGSIAITGALVQWLRDNLKMIKAAPEVEDLARSVDDNGGCYIVPAFSGLFAPYWKSNARGVVAGLTRYVTAGHIARDGRRLGRRARIAEGRRRHGRQRPADAVPGRPARRAGHPPEGPGDHVARRRLRGRPGDRLLGRGRGPARELGRGQALGAEHGFGAARRVLQVLEEGRHPDLRLVRSRRQLGRCCMRPWGRPARPGPPRPRLERSSRGRPAA
jgi:glycerol kinase